MIPLPFTDRYLPGLVGLAVGVVVALALLGNIGLALWVNRRRRPAAPAGEDEGTQAPVAVIRSAAFVALVAGFFVAAIGAWFSFHGLRDAARPAWGPEAWAFPLSVDGVILVGTLGYVVTVLRGHPLPMLQRLAYAGIGLTVFFNALASQRPGLVWWHVVPPLLWGVLAHIAAKLAMVRYVAQVEEVDPAEVRARLARITLPMWLTPIRTGQLWAYLARHPRVGLEEGQQHIELLRGARKALLMRLPGVTAWPTRRAIMGPVRAGVVPPRIVIEATRPNAAGEAPDAAAVHYAVLDKMLTEKLLRGGPGLPPVVEPAREAEPLATVASVVEVPGDPGVPPGRESRDAGSPPPPGDSPITLPDALPLPGWGGPKEAQEREAPRPFGVAWESREEAPQAGDGGTPLPAGAPVGSPLPGDGHLDARKAWVENATDEEVAQWVRAHGLRESANAIRGYFGFGGSSRQKRVAALLAKPQRNLISLPTNDA